MKEGLVSVLDLKELSNPMRTWSKRNHVSERLTQLTQITTLPNPDPLYTIALLQKELCTISYLFFYVVNCWYVW